MLGPARPPSIDIQNHHRTNTRAHERATPPPPPSKIKFLPFTKPKTNPPRPRLRPRQMYVVGRLTSRTSETLLVWASLAISTVMNLAEGTPSLFGLWGYLAIVIPARGVANACLSACLQSIFTQRVPQSDLGAALGALNVLKSASGVVGPLYGARLVGAWGVLARPTLTAVHYAGFFVLWWAMEVRGAAGGVSRGGGEGQGGSVDRMRSTERTKLK